MISPNRKIHRYIIIALILTAASYVGTSTFLIFSSVSSRYSTSPTIQDTQDIPDICLSQAASITGEIDPQCFDIHPKDKIKGFPFVWSTTVYAENGILDKNINNDLLYVDLILEASFVGLTYLIYMKLNKRHI